MERGDKIWITCEGRKVKGQITLASPNKISLMLSFEAMLAGHVIMMPVLRDEKGVYRSILNNVEVQIEPRE